MTDESTCGAGVAEQSVLPAKLGDLTAALADVLEAHTKSLVLTDQNAKLEYDAYVNLVRQHRQVSTHLHEAARQMAEYRDLPMGEHDVAVLLEPDAVEAFRRFVALERELAHLLQESTAEGEQMLAEMDS